MTAFELRQRRADTWAEMQAIAAALDERALTQQERDRWDALEKELKDLSGSIDIAERQPELRDRFGKNGPTPVDMTRAQTGPREWRSSDGRVVPVLGPEHRIASLAGGSEVGAELTLSRYVRGVVTGDWKGVDPEARAMAVGTGAAGGFLVPTPLSSRVIDKARNLAAVLRAGAQTVPMESNQLKIARVAGDPTAGWKSENAAATASDMTLEEVAFTSRTLMAFVKSSVELIEDSEPGIEDVIENALAQALALELDRAALRGSGTPPEPRASATRPA
jgi:HK97 family phage major capsid protein